MYSKLAGTWMYIKNALKKKLQQSRSRNVEGNSGASSSKEVKNEQHQGDYEQEMNESTGNMKSKSPNRFKTWQSGWPY